MGAIIKKNATYSFPVSLISQADTKLAKANPTLAVGDVKVSIDFGALNNIATLPDVAPAGGKEVRVQLSADEMNGDNIFVLFSDQAGAEWCDLPISIQTDPDTIAGYNSAIPTNVWANATRTLTSFGTLVADIWSYATRTLSSFGTLVATIWAYATRTLTQSAASVVSAVTGSNLVCRRGDTFVANLTGLGNISARTKLYFTVKRHFEDSDATSIIQINEIVVPGASTSLLYVNGRAWGTATDGKIVVTDAVTGALTITIESAATKELDIGDATYTYDITEITATTVATLTSGEFTVEAKTTKAVS